VPAGAIYENLASADKTVELVAGAHYLESPVGARTTVADLIHGWLESHR
jgi:hypothetical protein